MLPPEQTTQATHPWPKNIRHLKALKFTAASGVGHRRTSPRVLAAPLLLLPRLLELEVMRTSTGEASAVAVPDVAARKQERARCGLRRASEHPYLPLELSGLVEIELPDYAGGKPERQARRER